MIAALFLSICTYDNGSRFFAFVFLLWLWNTKTSFYWGLYRRNYNCTYYCLLVNI